MRSRAAGGPVDGEEPLVQKSPGQGIFLEGVCSSLLDWVARLPGFVIGLAASLNAGGLNELVLSVLAPAYFDTYGELLKKPQRALGLAALELEKDERLVPAFEAISGASAASWEFGTAFHHVEQPSSTTRCRCADRRLSPVQARSIMLGLPRTMALLQRWELCRMPKA
jgi:hypothetical protein